MLSGTLAAPFSSLQPWAPICTPPWPPLVLMPKVIPVPRTMEESDSDDFGRGLQGSEGEEEVQLSGDTLFIDLSQEEPP